MTESDLTMTKLFLGALDYVQKPTDVSFSGEGCTWLPGRKTAE